MDLTTIALMPIILPPILNGSISRGRWVGDLTTIEETYVKGRSDYHLKLWSEWKQVKDLLKGVLGTLPAAWLSGSFFTDKAQPSDIDCVFIVDQRTLSKVTDMQHLAFLEIVSKSQVRRYLNLRVDSYIMEWRPWQGVSAGRELDSILRRRGYWDEFWARMKDDDPTIAALPRRGYLEVLIDDYQQ